MRSFCLTWGLSLFTAALLAGCGNETATTPDSVAVSPGSGSGGQSAGTLDDGSASASRLPTASIAAGNSGSPDAAAGALPGEEAITTSAPVEGSPEWQILQITQLRLQPFPETDDVEAQRKSRKERNDQIIELATGVIAATHDKPEKEQVFNVAVHRLMEATYQLALQGDQESVTALYQHADSLRERDPQSRAAAEAGWFVARFANDSARRFAGQDQRWVREFSRQARLFADRFPTDERRAVPLLNDAAESCDFHQVHDEALLCYTALRQKYPESQQAQQATAAVRRLQLPGQLLDLGGPTIDGGFISVADFKGSPVLVVFWSSQARPFVEQAQSLIPQITELEKRGLQVVSVNLDADESAADRFMEQAGIAWRTIFHSDPARRGWNHPVAMHYGVKNIPQMWLVDREGKVISTTLQPETAAATISPVLTPAAAAE